MVIYWVGYTSFERGILFGFLVYYFFIKNDSRKQKKSKHPFKSILWSTFLPKGNLSKSSKNFNIIFYSCEYFIDHMIHNKVFMHIYTFAPTIPCQKLCYSTPCPKLQKFTIVSTPCIIITVWNTVLLMLQYHH